MEKSLSMMPKHNVGKDKKGFIEVIDNFFSNEDYDNLKFSEVKEIFFSKINHKQYENVKSFLTNTIYDKKMYEWNYFDKHHISYKINIRYLFQNLYIEFNYDSLFISTVKFLQDTMKTRDLLEKCR